MEIVYGDLEADNVIIRLTGQHEKNILPGEIKLLSANVSDKKWCIVPVYIDNWNYELAPWVSHVKPEETYGGGADTLLNHILHSVAAENKNYYIAGYSLAGLFSLWACYKTDFFKGAVAVSPSVWYEGWSDYIKGQSIMADKVYLSLGKKEHKTKHRLMCTVSDNIRMQYDRLVADNIKSCLEWNEGNHFTDVEKRMVKGYNWILNN